MEEMMGMLVMIHLPPSVKDKFHPHYKEKRDHKDVGWWIQHLNIKEK